MTGLKEKKLQAQKLLTIISTILNKKKLLILIDWFAPGYKAGGPIQSCINLCIALKENYTIYVLTTDTDHRENVPYPGIVANTWIYNNQLAVNIFYAKKKSLSANQLARQIALIDADFIYLNHLFSPYFVVYPLWLKFRHRVKAKVIVCPRGALYESALSLKSYKKKPLLYLYKWMGVHQEITFHATNEREKKAITLYFPGSKIVVADNLPESVQMAFTTCSKETGRLKCIFIARIVAIKNLLFLLRILRDLQEEISLTIVGPLENSDYWEDCKKSMAALPSNITINYIGAKPKDELPGLIQQHHLFILPTTGENFGHSIFEAMLSGRPVLISDQTPWLNLENQQAGWDVPLSEPAKFANVIQQMANADQYQFNNYATAAWRYAHHFISNPFAREQYLNLFK